MLKDIFGKKKSSYSSQGRNQNASEQGTSQVLSETFGQGDYEQQMEDAFEQSYNEKHEEFEKLKQQKLIISLIGSVNSGKSKTVNALTGINYASSRAIAGWTKEVSLYQLKDNCDVKTPR